MKLHYPLLVAVATLSATASINGVNSTTPSDTNPLDRKLSGNNQQIRSGNNRVVKTHEGDKYSDEGNSSDEERGGLDKIAKEVDDGIAKYRSLHGLHGLTEVDFNSGLWAKLYSHFDDFIAKKMDPDQMYTQMLRHNGGKKLEIDDRTLLEQYVLYWSLKHPNWVGTIDLPVDKSVVLKTATYGAT